MGMSDAAYRRAVEGFMGRAAPAGEAVELELFKAHHEQLIAELRATADALRQTVALKDEAIAPQAETVAALRKTIALQAETLATYQQALATISNSAHAPATTADAAS